MDSSKIGGGGSETNERVKRATKKKNKTAILEILSILVPFEFSRRSRFKGFLREVTANYPFYLKPLPGYW